MDHYNVATSWKNQKSSGTDFNVSKIDRAFSMEIVYFIHPRCPKPEFDASPKVLYSVLGRIIDFRLVHHDAFLHEVCVELLIWMKTPTYVNDIHTQWFTWLYSVSKNHIDWGYQTGVFARGLTYNAGNTVFALKISVSGDSLEILILCHSQNNGHFMCIVIGARSYN